MCDVRIQCDWFSILGLDEIYKDVLDLAVLQLNKNISNKLNLLLEKCLVYCDILDDELAIEILDNKGTLEFKKIESLITDTILDYYKDFIVSDSISNFMKSYNDKATEYITSFCKNYVKNFVNREIKLYKKSHRSFGSFF